MGPLVYRIVLAAVALAMLAPKNPSEPKFEVLALTTGHDTQVETSYLGLAEAQAGWDNIWQHHKGMRGAGNGLINGEPTPAVDFSKEMIIALFLGQQSNMTGFDLVDEKVTDEKITLKLRANYLPSGPGVLTSPYALMQVTPTKKPIEILFSADGQRWQSLGTVKRTTPMPKADSAPKLGGG
jgi:hypothetical protein